MKKYILVNNNIIANDSIAISSDDRSFLYGDATFQTVKIHNGILYGIDDYIKRIKLSAGLLKFNLKGFPNNESLKSNLYQLISLNKVTDGSLRINLSRGESSQGYLPTKECRPNIVASCRKRSSFQKEFKIGISSHRLWDIDSDLCKVKNAKSLNYIMAKIDANQKNNYDDVMLDKDSYVAECSSSNLFWIKNSKIYTSCEQCGIYPGYIRSKIINNKDFTILQGKYQITDLINSDEIFITNSNLLVQPIHYLITNNQEIKKEINYSDKIKQYIEKDLVDYCQNNQNIKS